VKYKNDEQKCMNQPNFNLGMLMTPDTKKFWQNCLVLLLELTISTTTLTVAHFDPHCQAFTCQYVLPSLYC